MYTMARAVGLVEAPHLVIVTDTCEAASGLRANDHKPDLVLGLGAGQGEDGGTEPVRHSPDMLYRYTLILAQQELCVPS